MKKTATLLLALLCFTAMAPAQRASLPYYNDFESGAADWISSDDGQSGTSWELGVPTIGFTIGAYSGNNCWDVNLNNGYTNNSVCYLISPVFDFSFVPQVHISFWTKYNTEYLWDYLTVQYTIDNGDNWTYLPFPNLISPDGYVPKWVKSSLTIDDLYGFPSVQFRLVFTSDNTITYDGYSIDDFRIDLDALSAPGSVAGEELFTMYPNPSNGEVNMSFSNYTSNSVVNILDVTGKSVFSQTLSELTGNSLHVSNLINGSYSVVYTDTDAVIVKRLVVVE